jgi:hypothetical protein
MGSCRKPLQERSAVGVNLVDGFGIEDLSLVKNRLSSGLDAFLPFSRSR